jgi:hypothetical protein
MSIGLYRHEDKVHFSVPNQEKASKIFIRTFESFYFCILGTSRA